VKQLIESPGEGLLCAEATLSFSRARHSGYIYHHAVSQLLLDPRYLALLIYVISDEKLRDMAPRRAISSDVNSLGMDIRTVGLDFRISEGKVKTR
jgi:hypothetical protein